MQVIVYAALNLILAGFSISRRLDDRRPGVIGLHSRLGLHRLMGYSIVSTAQLVLLIVSGA